MHDSINRGDGVTFTPQATDPTLVDYNSGALTIAAFGSEYARVVTSDVELPLAIWFLDIRNFRFINSQRGFETGNMVFHVLVDAMRELLCSKMLVARLGGDHFVALSTCITQDGLATTFDSFVLKLNERLVHKGFRQRLVISAGVYYLRPEDRKVVDFNPCLDYAAIAHRQARKKLVPGVVVFSDADLERDHRHLAIEGAFDKALTNGDIEVWYQPQIDYVYGEVIGAEALARWHDPQLGWIEASEFIPVLEACGKIYQLDSYIWEEACRRASRWRSMADGKPVPISVNLANLDLIEPQLIDNFVTLRKAYELPRGSIRLEIAERAFIEDPIHTYRLVHDMQDNFLTIEMDGFGGSQISLDMFDGVHVDAVKLDMGFMRSATSGNRSGVVLNAIIRMLQELDMPIIAKGVETIEQAEMLKNMGCHLMQGYLFSHPLPVDEFEQYMATNHTEEYAARRESKKLRLDKLFDVSMASSFLFNDAMGPSLFFCIDEGRVEGILINDQFYEACGLRRHDSGNKRVDLLSKIDKGSYDPLLRAMAEAREHGAAVCSAKILGDVWITCVMRSLGTSSRGDVFLMQVVRSSLASDAEQSSMQGMRGLGWDLDILSHIVPHGFIKCDTTDRLAFTYVSREFKQAFELSGSAIEQHYHNSLVEVVRPDDRTMLLNAVQRGKRTGQAFSCEVCLRSEQASGYREARLRGHIDTDDLGVSWLYALVESLEGVSLIRAPEVFQGEQDVTVVEYYFEEDRLIVRPPAVDGKTDELVMEGYLRALEENPVGITKASAARVMSLMHDLRHHPSSGFYDIRCSLYAGEDLEWYHVNFTCDSDEDGNATVMHGFARSANDQMGSVRWWREQAETDQLTSLLNRNAAELAINLAMRTQGRGIMFMIDMDSFKRVNDDLGHLVGDTLLRDVATALASKFRSGDVLGRYGGDEFIAFMPVATGDLAQLAERRARSIVEAIAAIDVGDGTYAACSVGVAMSTNREVTFYDLLEVADDAMYQSKERGKGTYTILTVDEETPED